MITLTEADIMGWLSPYFWPFIRVLALFTSAPVFSSRAFPVRARILLALCTVVAAQSSLPAMPVIALSEPQVLGVLVQQLVVGLALGFAVRLVFACAEFAGELVGAQMGLNYAAFFDPTLGGAASASSRFFAYMASLLFIAVNGHLLVMMAVLKSFEVFPIDQDWWQTLSVLKLHTQGAKLFASALWLALPMVGMLMFANLALGIMSRVAPQMNVFAIGFPVTLTVGLVGMAVTLPMFEQPLTRLLEQAVAQFVKA